ncbi:MAG TPA: hypothetical protein PLV85_25115, partial [Polyangiaceae bacterium]|nr:hypothetical protein [Polyangiaceae bacterium]
STTYIRFKGVRPAGNAQSITLCSSLDLTSTAYDVPAKTQTAAGRSATIFPARSVMLEVVTAPYFASAEYIAFAMAWDWPEAAPSASPPDSVICWKVTPCVRRQPCEIRRLG